MNLEGKSLVVLMPCYNDWESVASLVPEIDRTFANLGVNLTIIVVDDCSTIENNTGGLFNSDNFKAVRKISRIDLSHNIGSQSSIAIGIAYVSEHENADYLIVADSDHQDKPHDMIRLLIKCIEHHDKKIIFAKRYKRSENLLFRTCYFLFQVMFKLLTGARITMGSFSVTPWKFLTQLANLEDLWNYFPGAVIKSGIAYEQIECERDKRAYGTGKMNLELWLIHAFNAFSLFSNVAAARILLCAFYSICILFVCGLILVGLKVFTDIPIIGWTSILLAVMGVVVMQILTASGMLLLLISFMQSHTSNTPKKEYENYILTINEMYPNLV